MEKEIFKVGDRVYHIFYGWGEVTEVCEYVFDVTFDDTSEPAEFMFGEDNLISFTEYTLQGFSQERPIELPEVGELCLVRDYDDREWSVKKFSNYEPKDNYPYRVERNDTGYKQMKRIKILD